MSIKILERKIERIGFEWSAICLFVIFAIAVRVVTPPYQLADEINHFARAWQVSEGKIFSQTVEVRAIERGDNPTTNDQVRWSCRGERLTLLTEDEKFFAVKVPRSLMPAEFVLDVPNKFHAISFDMQKKFLSTPLDAHETEWHLIPNTGSYSPAAYFPQAIAALVGRLLNLSAGAIYYLMCLSALLFAATCLFAAMKLLPEKKILIFVTACLPMFLAETASTSADAVIYAICFLGTAWLLSLRRSTEILSRTEFFALIIFAVALGLLKQVYGAILLLYFLIPRARFKSTFRFVSTGIFLLATEAAVSTAWLYLSGDGGRVPLFTGFYMGLEGIDVAAQKNFMLAHPTEFLRAFATTLLRPDVWFAKTFVGVLGIVNVYFPKIFYVGCSMLLLVAGAVGDLRLRPLERLLMIFAAFVTALGIFAIEYLVWTPVGASVIAGVQGRYFIPIALLTLSTLSLIKPPRFANFSVLTAGTLTAAATVWITCSRFY